MTYLKPNTVQRILVFLLPVILLLIVTPLHLRAQEAGEQGPETISPSPSPSTSPTDLIERQKQLDELEKQIKNLSVKKAGAQTEADQASVQLETIQTNINATKLQLAQTKDTTVRTADQISKTNIDIKHLESQLQASRTHLAHTIRSLHQHSQHSFIDILLSDQTFSEVLQQQLAYQNLQTQLYEVINNMRGTQQELDENLEQMEGEISQLQRLQQSQSQQQRDLKDKEEEQQDFLTLKEGEKAKYDQKIAEAKQAREEINQSVFRLKSLKQELKLDDVYDAARYASRLTGVRPALLLGILKVETNLGTNVGSGHYPDDMHPGSRDAFLRITKQLGLDPYTTPVSRKPTTIQGWGGAMGPGQIMPATWEGLAARVSSIGGRTPPDPFNLADSLVAMGIMMADRGATVREKEVEAVARYMAGPNWQYHMWYAQRVLAVAAEYEAGGLSSP